jgi:hypothetical protein
MTRAHHFLMHTFAGRMIIVAVFLVLGLLVASLAGWLPELQ